jgi:hypothetical protein
LEHEQYSKIKIIRGLDMPVRESVTIICLLLVRQRYVSGWMRGRSVTQGKRHEKQSEVVPILRDEALISKTHQSLNLWRPLVRSVKSIKDS